MDVELKKRINSFAIDISLRHNLSDTNLLEEYIRHWTEAAFTYIKSNDFEQVRCDVEILALNSFHTHQRYESWGHSHQFCQIVARTLDLNKGLFFAYRQMDKKSRYCEAINEYMQRGFSPVYAHRIATRISEVRLTNAAFVAAIEDEVQLYEQQMKSKLLEGRNIWQAYIYADAYSLCGAKHAQELLGMIDRGVFKLSNEYAKDPDKFMENIVPKEEFRK